MTTTCSESPNQIREEGDRLIKEFHEKYRDITQKEIIAFSNRGKEIEEEFYKKIRIDLYNLGDMKKDLETEKDKLFRFNTFKRFLFWFGCITNIGSLSILLAILVLHYL